MKKISIIADTTCDLSAELKEKYQIDTFPLQIHLGDAEYSDGVDISPEEIYRWSDETKVTPKTSIWRKKLKKFKTAPHIAGFVFVIPSEGRNKGIHGL